MAREDNHYLWQSTISLGAFSIRLYILQRIDNPVGFFSTHNCYEVHHCMEGQVEIEMEDETIILNKGDVSWMSPGISHKSTTIGMGESYSMLFDIVMPTADAYRKLHPNQSAEMDLFLNNVPDKPVIVVRQRSGLSRHLTKILELSEKAGSWGSYPQAQHVLAEYLICLIRQMVPDQENKDAVSQANYVPNNAFQILSYIRQNYNQPISLDTIATRFSISKRQVNRYIQEQSGQTFKRILLEMRLGYAKLYLDNSDYSVERICELVGFESPSYFYMVFKANVGQTVSEYRNRKKNPLAQ